MANTKVRENGKPKGHNLLPIDRGTKFWKRDKRRIRIMLDNVQYVGDEEVKELKEFYERVKRECKFE